MTALQDIDLELAPREFVSLIGPSGCGKTTLLRVIGDLSEPTGGAITVNGKTARRGSPRRRLRLRVPGAGALSTGGRSRSNVTLPLEILGWERRRAATGSRDLLELVELDGLRRTPSLAALGRHAAAGRDRPGARVRPVAAADGRAVRRARRDDAATGSTSSCSGSGRRPARPSSSSPTRSPRPSSSRPASS